MTERIVLDYGSVGDHDGAYDWVRPEDYDKMEYAVGFHESAWPGESYTVREVLPLVALAAKEIKENKMNQLELTEKALRIAAGMISTQPPYADKHPQNVYDDLMRMAEEDYPRPDEDGAL
jgi:hypothetical protein